VSPREAIGRLVACRAPRPICDACLADHLALSARQVAAAASRLRHDPGFSRFTGRCSGCCTARRVTGAREA
jgi:hypothetical protein